jgi:hypothetical protein
MPVVVGDFARAMLLGYLVLGQTGEKDSLELRTHTSTAIFRLRKHLELVLIETPMKR